jgi:hypothetical protein
MGRTDGRESRRDGTAEMPGRGASAGQDLTMRSTVGGIRPVGGLKRSLVLAFKAT